MTLRSESGPESTTSGMKISNRCRGRPNPYGGAGIRAGSMPKGDRPIVLYPAYFDLARTRGQGLSVDPGEGHRWEPSIINGPSVAACAGGRDYCAGQPHDHRVVGGGHDPAAYIEERGIHQHGPRPDQRVQEGRCPRLEPMGPTFG